MKDFDTVYTDASCYESLMRFPTDVKLLSESVERAYRMMCDISSQPHMSEKLTRVPVKNASNRELARVRATAMEDSFGTQKEHYGLRKVVARIKTTEIMLIFFGIHTANVVNHARRESVKVALAA